MTSNDEVTLSAWVAEHIRTGVQSMDTFDMRGRIARWSVRVFAEDAAMDIRIPRALMAILNNESRGNPPYLGDQSLPGGPSIGPMQVYRTTAKALGLWLPPKNMTEVKQRIEYAKLASNIDQGIEWGVRVFADKLKQARGDLSEAIRRYNGSGPRAEAYRDRALEFYRQRWGDITKPAEKGDA